MKKYLKLDNFFIISMGAIPAAIFRWQIDEIFIVNIIGCFLLGLINALSISRKSKLFLGVGFCGSFTTFSGWIFVLLKLLNDGFYEQFFLNSISFVLLGLFSVALGDLVAKKILN